MNKRQRTNEVYCLADTYIFKQVHNKESRLYGNTIFIKINRRSKIEEIGTGIEGRLGVPIDSLIEQSTIACEEDKRLLRSIDMQYFALHAVDFSRSKEF